MRGEQAVRLAFCAGVMLRWVESSNDAKTRSAPLARGSPLVHEAWLEPYIRQRTPTVKSTSQMDCFFSSRKINRPNPSDCYGQNFEFNANAWWQFWQEVRGDLQYTFDFVLYQEYFPLGGHDQTVTSFWMLIAYLKHLATVIPDPNDVASGNLRSTKQAIFDTLKAELEELNKKAEAAAAQLDEIVRSMHHGPGSLYNTAPHVFLDI